MLIKALTVAFSRRQPCACSWMCWRTPRCDSPSVAKPSQKSSAEERLSSTVRVARSRSCVRAAIARTSKLAVKIGPGPTAVRGFKFKRRSPRPALLRLLCLRLALNGSAHGGASIDASRHARSGTIAALRTAFSGHKTAPAASSSAEFLRTQYYTMEEYVASALADISIDGTQILLDPFAGGRRAPGCSAARCARRSSTAACSSESSRASTSSGIS